MATWPVTLPNKVLAEGYIISPGSQVLRSDMEVGPARVRRITNQRNDRVPLLLAFTPAQLTIFRDWFDGSTGLAGGVNWFTGLRIIVDGDPTTTKECRFDGDHEFRQKAGSWQITGTLEVR